MFHLPACMLPAQLGLRLSNGIARLHAGAPAAIFDQSLKTLHRSKAASNSNADANDFLHDHVAQEIVSRLYDISRDFPVAVDAGCRRGHIWAALDEARRSHGRVPGGIQELLQLDTSSTCVDTAVARAAGSSPAARGRVCGTELSLSSVATGSADIVLSSLALHWTNDLPSFFSEVRRVLRPDGVFLAAMLGGDTLVELRTSLAIAEQEREGGVGGHVSPLAQISDVAPLINAAGLAIPTLDTSRIVVDFPDAFACMESLSAMGESSAAIARRRGIGRHTLLAAAAAYQELFGGTEGCDGIPVTFQVLYLIGWAPSDNQPTSLQPGAGEVSLQDVLNPRNER